VPVACVGYGRQWAVTQEESAELDGNEEDDEVRWMVCEPVYYVAGVGDGCGPGLREVVPGVDYVAAWRVEREAVRRLTVVERRRLQW
jgi:hypothetical protein